LAYSYLSQIKVDTVSQNRYSEEINNRIERLINMHIRPICINHGCNRPVAHSGTRYRPVCGLCHQAGYNKIPFKWGVTPFRTGRCNNADSHLGFTCAIDYDKAPWTLGKTHIDHIDGNHLNNVLSNVVELCPLCHQHKGMLAGDFKNQGVYHYNKK
jgi:hypothetical protein